MFYKQKVEWEKLKSGRMLFSGYIHYTHEPSSIICSRTIFTSALYVSYVRFNHFREVKNQASNANIKNNRSKVANRR